MPTSGLTFVRLYLGRDMRTAQGGAYWGRPIAVGAVGTANVTGDTATVNTIMNIGELSFTSTPGDTTADVNLADKISGKTVYTNLTFLGASMNVDTPNSEKELAIANFVYGRFSGITITLNFISEKGQNIRTAEKFTADYGSAGAAYSVTPPGITGYTFLSADKELSGSPDADLTITLTYKAVTFSITLEFVDENGNKIKDDRIVDAEYRAVIDIIIDEIEGYVYVSNTLRQTNTGILTIDVVRDLTIRITYAEVESEPEPEPGGGGCKKNAGAAVFAALLALAGAVLIAKKRG